MALCAPSPSATMVMTAPTPMIMPSIVRAVRSLLRPRAFSAIRKTMNTDIRFFYLVDVRVALTTTPAAAKTAWTAAVPTTLLEWIPSSGARSRPRGSDAGYARDDLRADRDLFSNLLCDELGVRAIGDSQSHIRRLELLIDVEPQAAARFNRWERREERIDGRARLRLAVLR